MGQNGWHPHNHILLLTKYTVLGFESYRNELARIWISSCLKAGLRSPSMEHGLDIRDGSHADEYISKYGLPDQNKWGLPEEITKGHMKKGRNGGFTPFDLLSYLSKISLYTVINYLLNYFRNLLFRLKVLLNLFGVVVLKNYFVLKKKQIRN